MESMVKCPYAIQAVVRVDLEKKKAAEPASLG